MEVFSRYINRLTVREATVSSGWLLVPCILCCSLGCSDRIKPSTVTQVREFSQLPPPGPAIDLDKVVGAKIPTGPYAVVPGDVLEITLPAILCVETTERVVSPDGMTRLPCRVTGRGTVSLPVVGELKVTGLRLEEVERAIADAYHQTYSTEYPAVFVRIQEYRMQRVSIVGAVATPGIYDLRNDQMSLVSLLMAAGGITADGASKIRIVHDKGQPPDSYTVQAASQKSPTDAFTRDLRMTFLPHGAGHTRGRLSVYYRNDIVLSDTLDLSEDTQRMAFMSELDDKLPRLSLAAVKTELVRLPQVMKSRRELSRGTNQGRNTFTGANPIGFAGYDVHGAQVGPSLSPRSYAIGQAEAKQQPRSERTLVLPVRGLNIPFADVALEAGDRVTVEPLVMPMFTVIGLVNNQGNFEYPPGETYNLMEAIGFAQGLDRVADPRYAVIYRLTTDGNIVHTHYNISKAAHDDSELTAAMNTIIRPGDIVDIAQTPRTRTRVFLANIFRITIGAYVPIWDGHY